MSGTKVEIEEMGNILFGMLGGISTQNGRIVRALLQKIEVQKHHIKKLEEELNDKSNTSKNKQRKVR